MIWQIRVPVSSGAFSTAELQKLIAARPRKIRATHARGLADLCDILDAENWSVSFTAKRIGVTTGQLSRVLLPDPQLLHKVNEERAKRGLVPLKKLQ